MRFAIGLAGVFCIAMAGGCARVYPPDPEHDVDIVARDGLVLKASYFSPGKPGPAILLIHQCNMDRHAWDRLTPDLTRAGLHVLTFDQRGFGGTGGKADQQKTSGDADAAYAYLVSKKDVDKTRLAAGGASCGVTFSSELAVRHREITALLLLSGWTTDASRAYFAATPSLAIFGAAADAGSDTADIRQAVAASKNPESTLKTYRGSAHGVAMFGAHPDLEPAIMKWLQAQLLSGGQISNVQSPRISTTLSDRSADRRDPAIPIGATSESRDTRQTVNRAAPRRGSGRPESHRRAQRDGRAGCSAKCRDRSAGHGRRCGGRGFVREFRGSAERNGRIPSIG